MTIHMNPYRDQALNYYNAYFFGALPLPYKQKEKPPTDWTGHRAKHPTRDKIREWMGNGRQNICVRLAGVTEDHELVGIDVDHYVKGSKTKKGGDQLAELETRLGPLPATWIATSRTDGISGIRFFRVPRGYSFRGQVAKDIECISKGYRYAIVWPSVHPDNGQTYWWYPPGVAPTEEGRLVWQEGELPKAKDFPILPDTWLIHLTQGKMRTADDDRIDMDTNIGEIYAWADDTFWGESDDEPCSIMRQKLDKHKALISEEATSHDKLVNAHFNLLSLALEGHVGWNAAVNELEKHFRDVMLEREKRDLSEVRGEVERSRMNGLRRIKAKSDQMVATGAAPVLPCCAQTGQCGGAAPTPESDTDDPLADVPQGGGLKGVPEYERNDDGNALHLIHMFSSDTGPSFRWAEGYGWIVWHGGDSPHWELDRDGKGAIRRMWHKVKMRQQAYADACRATYETELRAAVNAGLPISGGGAPASLLAARADLKTWSDWAERSGNNRQAENAIEAAKSMFASMAIDLNELDKKWQLLGVANGVLELGEQVTLRPARPDDFITLNTHVPWEKPSNFAKIKWQEYLETFLPDPEFRRVVQILLGHCIVGGNKHKILIALKGDPNTGKSTMINAIEAALGDYAQTVDQGMLQNRQFNSTLVKAMNKRVAICSEFDHTSDLSASMIKRITGGTDKISSEVKYSMATVEGYVGFNLILASNGVPQISGSDKALKNRLRTIPFNVVPERLDASAGDVILAVCKTAVLDWLIEGYEEYRRLGDLPTHPLIEEATDEFIAELDEVATFAQECLARHTHMDKADVQWQDKPEWCIQSTKLYERFERWWIENKFPMHEKPSIVKFTRRMKAHGYKCSQVRFEKVNAKFYVGVKFKKTTSTVITPTVEGWATGLKTESSAPVSDNSKQNDKPETNKIPGQE